MATALPRFATPPSAPDLRSALESAGAAIVEKAATADLMGRIEDELAPWFERTPPGEGPFFGRRTRRFGAVFAKAPSTAPLAIDPLILSVFDELLCRPGGGGATERSDCLQLSLTQAISISPSEAAQFLHRDDSLYPIVPGFELMANVMWSIDPFTETNGATRVAPGSHRWARDRIAGEEDVVTAAMPAGSALIWLGSTLHGGGANRSPHARRGLVFSYSLAWLAQAEKLMVSVPPAVVRTLPVRLQRLIGYQIHRPNLGWIEGRDPLEWLHGDIADTAAAQDNLKPAQAAMLSAAMAALAATPMRVPR
jgi:hypothetical protein